MRNLKPIELVEAAGYVLSRWPDAELVKNQVGNLSVVIDDEMVAWVDLRTGEVDDGVDEQ